MKNFFSDSKLAHFWLFFTRIPADPRAGVQLRLRADQRGLLRGRRRPESHRDPARAGPAATGHRPHVRHRHPGARPVHKGRADP
ncbi:hypothetical protein XFF6166_290026 [Xanthomonas citri pv. fuscans]|nr:hypothetical protein XFF6166_290026 [Xanthomonas citri pv. fuscans]SOO04113.1 hypothetical protein XFF7767_230002 [Xanthomonas citri pv. fuscans]SOO14844.1 hypothetical protein XFF7766_40023 [Xanthomonas citri pv. fuscans]